MEPALVMSAASALAYAAQPVGGAFPSYDQSDNLGVTHSVRIMTPVIILSSVPVEIEPELEAVIYSSMEHDFERRYAL